MDHVPSIKKRRKGWWRIEGLIIVMILIAGCIIGLAIKRKPKQTSGDICGMQAILSLSPKEKQLLAVETAMGKQADLSLFFIMREKQFIEFEKLFREQQDDIKNLAEELISVNILERKEYLILFDKEGYLQRQMGNPLGNHIEILYSDDIFISEENEELVGNLNENIALKNALNSIIEKGIIMEIIGYFTGDIWILAFTVDTKFTPFITGNNGAINAFKYCEDKSWDANGYNKKIEDNWYLWISPAPE